MAVRLNKVLMLDEEASSDGILKPKQRKRI
jgi:hypothetical protein